MEYNDFKGWLMPLLFCLTVTSAPLKAQEAPDAPAVPDGFGLNELQTTENLSSGVLNINLPIESHLIPVSISYTTSGIRVSERADIVGLGWNLNAGGSIQRQKRGISDDKPYGYSGQYKTGQYVTGIIPTNAEIFQKMTITKDHTTYAYHPRYDTEPDIYSFQFLGYSGRFTLDRNREVVKLTANNLKIIPTFDNTYGFTSFKIVDESGNEYYFGLSGKREKTTIHDGDELIDDYHSKWLLSKIVNYVTNDVILFNYKSSNYTETSTYNSVTRYWNGGIVDGGTTNKERKITYYGFLLDEITHKESKIKFTYGSRTDVSTLSKVDRISYELEGLPHVEYRFKYKYLGNRLMLSGVSKTTESHILYQFSYFGERSDEFVLPSYNSSKQDIWGFHNNNTSSTLFDDLSANRTSSLSHTEANSLKKIFYTEGAYDEFEYDLNDATIPPSTYAQSGGLRISKVYKDSGDGTRYLQRSYDYRYPKVNGDPLSEKTSGKRYNGSLSSHKYYYENINWENHDTYKVHSEQSLTRLADDLGRHILYEYVTVTDLDGGKTRHKFYTFTDDAAYGTGQPRPISLQGLDQNFKYTDQCFLRGLIHLISADTFEFGQRSFRGNRSGLASEVIIMDADGNWIQKESYTYGYKNHTTEVWAMNTMEMALNEYKHFTNALHTSWYTGRQIDYMVSFYTLSNGYPQLSQVATTMYDVNNVSNNTTQIKTIEYHDIHPLPELETSYNLSTPNEVQKSETIYFFDVATSTRLTEVNAHNLLGVISEKKSYINNVLIGKTVMDYGINTSTTKLQNTIQQSYLNNVMVDHVTMQYDANGRLAQTTNVMDANFTNAQFYSENGQFVTAQVSNATFSECGYASFDDNAITGWNIPALKTVSPCYEAQAICMSDCYDDANPSACFTNCYAVLNNCLGLATTDLGLFAKYAYKLSFGNITKSVAPGDYILSFWKKSGTVNITGATSKQLIKSQTYNEWSYEEHLINRTTTGNIVLSLGTGTTRIDELKIYPKDAQMESTTYQNVFGVQSKTDANNNFIRYEYDAIGRLKIVRDKNNDILSEMDYIIAPYLNVSEATYSNYFKDGSKQIYIASNAASWTVSDNQSWITTSATTGSYLGGFTIIAAYNPTTTARSGTVTITGGGASNTITVTQSAAPSSNYIEPSYTSNFNGNNSMIATIYSNVAWTASLNGNASITISTTSGGAGKSTMNIYCNNCYSGSGGGSAIVTLSGGGLTSYISVYYTNY